VGVTFAPNGIYVGIGLGVVAGLASENLVAGIVVAIVGSVAAWWAIVGIEHLIGRGVEAGATAIGNAYQSRKSRQAPQPPPNPHPGAYGSQPGAYGNQAGWPGQQPAAGYLSPAPPPPGPAAAPGYDNAPAPQWPTYGRG